MSACVDPTTKVLMHPSELRFFKVKLDPEKPFDLEDFCKDIPISVLAFGIRFYLAFIPEQKLPDFFSFLKASFPNQSWANLAADKSYIDISFNDQEEAKEASQKEFVFQEHKLKPITTLCYKKQLAFVILKDFTSHPTLEEVEKRVMEMIYTLGTPIKVAYLEISNTQFLAPLVAAIVAIAGDKLPEPLLPSTTQSQQTISYIFKGLVEYCSACNKLGHIYCNFNPPKPEADTKPELPANGHGAGDLKAAPLTALNSRGTSIPLAHYNGGATLSNPKSVTTQMLSFEDIIQSSLGPPKSKPISAVPLNGFKESYTAEEYNELKSKFDNLYAAYSKLLSPNVQNALAAKHPSQPKESRGQAKSQAPSILSAPSTGGGRKRGRPRKDASADEYSTVFVKPMTKPLSQAQKPQALAPKTGLGRGKGREVESYSTTNPLDTTLSPGLTTASNSAPAMAGTSAVVSVPIALTSDQPRKRGRPKKVHFEPAVGVSPHVSPKTSQPSVKDEAQDQTSAQAVNASGSVNAEPSQVIAAPHSDAAFPQAQGVVQTSDAISQLVMAQLPSSTSQPNPSNGAAPDVLVDPFSVAGSSVDFVAPSFMFMQSSGMESSSIPISDLNSDSLLPPSGQPLELAPGSQGHDVGVPPEASI